MASYLHHKNKVEHEERDRYSPPHHSRGMVNLKDKLYAYSPVVYMILLLTVIIFMTDLFYHPSYYSPSSSSHSSSARSGPSSSDGLRIDPLFGTAGIVTTSAAAVGAAIVEGGGDTGGGGSTSLRGTSTKNDFFSFPSIRHEQLRQVERLIVIPGGGGGGGSSADSSNPGYPEWTKRRVIEAVKYYQQELTLEQREKTIFLLLSAGSLNTPNALQPADHRIIFENQHMIHHLRDLGISSERIYADIFSWDTVTNGFSLRLFIESLMNYHPLPPSSSPISASNSHNNSPKQVKQQATPWILTIDVFISEFHLKRVEAAFTWSLSLSPAIVTSSTETTSNNNNNNNASPIQAKLSMHSVSSEGIAELTAEALAERAKHEEEGILRIQNQMKSVKTIPQFYAFLLFGGHAGIRNYLFDSYVKSSGVGW